MNGNVVVKDPDQILSLIFGGMGEAISWSKINITGFWVMSLPNPGIDEMSWAGKGSSRALLFLPMLIVQTFALGTLPKLKVTAARANLYASGS